MRRSAAEQEAAHRSAILLQARHRAQHPDLIQCDLAVMPVAAGGAEAGLDIGRGLQPLRHDAVLKARQMRLQEIDHARSEEHTSELQSLMRISYAVFCLKKKKRY